MEEPETLVERKGSRLGPTFLFQYILSYNTVQEQNRSIQISACLFTPLLLSTFLTTFLEVDLG